MADECPAFLMLRTVVKPELLVTVSNGSHSFPRDFEMFLVMADFL